MSGIGGNLKICARLGKLIDLRFPCSGKRRKNFRSQLARPRVPLALLKPQTAVPRLRPERPR